MSCLIYLFVPLCPCSADCTLGERDLAEQSSMAQKNNLGSGDLPSNLTIGLLQSCMYHCYGLDCIHKKRYVEVLTFSTSLSNTIWK